MIKALKRLPHYYRTYWHKPGPHCEGPTNWWTVLQVWWIIEVKA